MEDTLQSLFDGLVLILMGVMWLFAVRKLVRVPMNALGRIYHFCAVAVSTLMIPATLLHWEGAWLTLTVGFFIVLALVCYYRAGQQKAHKGRIQR